MGKIRHQQKSDGDIVILKVSGEIFSPNVSEFDEILNNAIEDSNQIILNFSELKYLCSAAIGCLIGYFNQAKQKGGKIVIMKMNKKLSKVLDRIGFPSIIEIAQSLEEAKGYF